MCPFDMARLHAVDSGLWLVVSRALKCDGVIWSGRGGAVGFMGDLLSLLARGPWMSRISARSAAAESMGVPRFLGGPRFR